MGELTKQQIEEWLAFEETEFYIDKFRAKHQITPDSSNLYVAFNRLCREKKLRVLGRGLYKKVEQVKPVSVFGKARERRPPFDLYFPRDYTTWLPMEIGNDIVIREGDVVTIGGMSNWGKTTLALNFCGENIDSHPIIMGNEYTTFNNKTEEHEPTPRFINRLDNMEWIEWTNGNGEDKFELLPVTDDYAEHIVKDRINIIDWINLDGDKLYYISKIMANIKAEIGKGVAVLVLQKGEGSNAPRGGQFAKDFTDCELLIDRFSEHESMITIGKVKEYTRPVMGRKFVFGISQGVKLINMREVVPCPQCYGKGWKRAGNSSLPCTDCMRTGYVTL